MSHFREVYECGCPGRQCRCASNIKSVTKLKGICAACARSLEMLIAEVK